MSASVCQCQSRSNVTLTYSYTNIIKMETFHRDSLALKNKLNLNINVEFTRKEGKEGHTTVDRYQSIWTLK